MIRALVILGALAGAVYAESPKVEQARQALDAVHYDEAQRLLIGALQEGTSSPASLREIYRLSASTAVVLGQADAAEQYYRRWLALDPTATLGADVAPKLRAPFDAAKAYIAAHGHFEVTASRVSEHEIEIVVISDPLAMARNAWLVPPSQGQTMMPLTTDRRARLSSESTGPLHAVVSDEYGNALAELDVAPGAPEPPPPRPEQPRPRPDAPAPAPERHYGALLGWGIPCAVFLGSGIGFGTAAIYEHAQIGDLTSNSKDHYYSEVADRRHLRTVFTWLGGSFLAVGSLLVIPTAIYWARSRHAGDHAVAPFVGQDSAGVSLSGRF